MKKCAALLTALLMVLNWLPRSLGVPESHTSGDFSYSLENGNATITGYSGSASQLVIPELLDTHPVVMIGDNAFSECGSLTAVTIPKGVTGIGRWAFSRCGGMINITLPESLLNIGYYALSSCSALKDIVLPESLVSIGEGSFAYCVSLADLTIPAGVVDIAGGAFDATGLHRIRVSKGNPVYTTFGGVLYDKTQNMLHTYLSDKKEQSYVVLQGTQRIGKKAFSRYDNLKSIILPDSLTDIGESSFSNCTGLTELHIPGSVTSIGQWAFDNCYRLKSISLPDSLTAIGVQAFSHCTGLSDILIPAGVTSIGSGAFYDTAFTEILLADGNTVYSQIDGVLFDRTLALLHTYPCKKASGGYRIPQGTQTIGKFAFYGCSDLTGVTIPGGVTAVEWAAFSDCIGLTRVNLPDSVVSIGDYAFNNCTALAGVSIPSSVASIGRFVFDSCPNLTLYVTQESYAQQYAEQNKLKYKAGESMPENNGRADTSFVSGDFAYTMPYSGAVITGYKGSAVMLTVPGQLDGHNVTGIGKNAFYGCESLENVILPEGIIQIGDYAFSSCVNLEGILIPESVAGIGSMAFYSCGKITGIDIPKSVVSIGSGAFCGTSLETIRLKKGNTVYALSGGALYDKTQKMLHTYPCSRPETSYTIPKNTAAIGDWAFADCTALTTIVIPKSVTVIGNQAFMRCGSLTDVTLPNSVTDIGYWSFSYCESLTALTIPESVTKIGANAFFCCTALFNINIPVNVQTIGRGVFTGTQLKKIEVAGKNPVYTQIGGVLFDKKQKMLHSYPGGKTAAEYSVPEGIISIGEWAFSRCENLESIILPDSVTNIGSEAFSYCGNLTAVTLPDSLKIVGSKAFNSCLHLESLAVPDSVESIGKEAFSECENLYLMVKEGSTAHLYAEENNVAYSFDPDWL